MAAHSSEIIPHFDFTEALRYDPDERMRLCVDRVRDRLSDEGLWDLLLIPPVPEMGAMQGSCETWNPFWKYRSRRSIGHSWRIGDT